MVTPQSARPLRLTAPAEPSAAPHDNQALDWRHRLAHELQAITAAWRAVAARLDADAAALMAATADLLDRHRDEPPAEWTPEPALTAVLAPGDRRIADELINLATDLGADGRGDDLAEDLRDRAGVYRFASVLRDLADDDPALGRRSADITITPPAGEDPDPVDVVLVITAATTASLDTALRAWATELTDLVPQPPGPESMARQHFLATVDHPLPGTRPQIGTYLVRIEVPVSTAALSARRNARRLACHTYRSLITVPVR